MPFPIACNVPTLDLQTVFYTHPVLYLEVDGHTVLGGFDNRDLGNVPSVSPDVEDRHHESLRYSGDRISYHYLQTLNLGVEQVGSFSE